jgi:hypothetical protein
MNVVAQLNADFLANSGVTLEQALPVAIMILLWGAFEVILHTDKPYNT